MDQTHAKLDLEMLLRDMYEALTELAVVLENEHHALQHSDIDTLHKAAASKEQLSHKLEQLEKTRVNMLQTAGLELDNAGMQQFIQIYMGNNADSLNEIWVMVEEVACKCDTQNRINGIVIDNSKRQTQEALAILRGQFGTEDTLYDADGGSVSQATNSTLARA